MKDSQLYDRSEVGSNHNHKEMLGVFDGSEAVFVVSLD